MYDDKTIEYIKTRVKDFFERKIDATDDAETQLLLASIAREVIATINHS